MSVPFIGRKIRLENPSHMYDFMRSDFLEDDLTSHRMSIADGVPMTRLNARIRISGKDRHGNPIPNKIFVRPYVYEFNYDVRPSRENENPELIIEGGRDNGQVCRYFSISFIRDNTERLNLFPIGIPGIVPILSIETVEQDADVTIFSEDDDQKDDYVFFYTELAPLPEEIPEIPLNEQRFIDFSRELEERIRERPADLEQHRDSLIQDLRERLFGNEEIGNEEILPHAGGKLTRKKKYKNLRSRKSRLHQFSFNMLPKGAGMNRFDRLLSASTMRKGVKKNTKKRKSKRQIKK